MSTNLNKVSLNEKKTKTILSHQVVRYVVSCKQQQQKSKSYPGVSTLFTHICNSMEKDMEE